MQHPGRIFAFLIAPIGGFDANIIAMMIDLKEINKELSLTQKIDLALKTNHYVVWKVTVMDIIILTAVSVGVSMTLIKTTPLHIMAVMAIVAGLCAVIEFVRIKTRRAKILHYTLQKARKAERLMQLYVDCCQLYGSEEDYATAQNLMEMLVLAREEVSRRAEECEDMWFENLKNIFKKNVW